MSSKRAFAEVEPSGAPRDAGANKKRKAFNNTHYRTVKDGRHGAASGQTLNEVKKRARDIERRFAKGELPADVQRNLERELAHCRRQIEELTHKKKRSDMISRYHKVRFFERQKAERLRKQLRKRIHEVTDPEEKAQLEKDYHVADVDWHYAKYFPFLEPYIGLYPKTEEQEQSGDKPRAKRALHSDRPPMWKVIEGAMEQGEDALVRIQERRPEGEVTARPVPEQPKKLVSNKKAEGRGSKPVKSSKGSKFGESEQEKPKWKNAGEQEAEQEDSGNDTDGSGFFA